jgi:hypothetical protein
MSDGRGACEREVIELARHLLEGGQLDQCDGHPDLFQGLVLRPDESGGAWPVCYPVLLRRFPDGSVLAYAGEVIDRETRRTPHPRAPREGYDFAVRLPDDLAEKARPLLARAQREAPRRRRQLEDQRAAARKRARKLAKRLDQARDALEQVLDLGLGDYAVGQLDRIERHLGHSFRRLRRATRVAEGLFGEGFHSELREKFPRLSE